MKAWKSLLAYLPVETVIRDRQQAYYQVLAQSDTKADITPFVATDQVDDQVSDQVAQLLKEIGNKEQSANDLIHPINNTFRYNRRS